MRILKMSSNHNAQLAWRRLVARQHLDDLWLSTWSIKQPFLRSFVLFYFGISLLKRWFFWAFRGVATIMDKRPWDSNAVFIFFCHFWVSSWNSASLACEQALAFGKGWKKVAFTLPNSPLDRRPAHRLCILFEIFLQFSLLTLFKWNSKKKSGYRHPTLFVGLGQGWVSVNWKMPQKCKCPKTFIHDCRIVCTVFQIP